MLLQTTAQKVLLACIAALLLVTTGKDWLDFYSCGAVSQCLADAGTLQLYTKFLMSLLLTVLAFIVTRNSFSRLDAKILRFAFVFSLLADSCFCIIKAVLPNARTLSDILGIAFFIMFQIVLVHRHTRRSETDTKPSKVHKFVFYPLAGLAGGLFGGILDITRANVMLVIVALYSAFLITSVLVAFFAPCRDYFPAKNIPFIRWGMVAFFIGDAFVGLSMLTGEDHSALQVVAEISNNLIWWAYVPAQLMLILSTKKGIRPRWNTRNYYY